MTKQFRFNYINIDLSFTFDVNLGNCRDSDATIMIEMFIFRGSTT